MDRTRNLAQAQEQILKQAAKEIEPPKEPEEKASESKEEPKKPKEKKPVPPKIKQYFTVKLEVMAPVTLTYRVFADDEEQALELLQKSPMVAPPKPAYNKMKKIKASVYLAGTSLIKLIKKF